MILKNLFDSHVHFMATGQLSQILDLKTLNSWGELSNLEVPMGSYRGDWLIGFGWDESKVLEKRIPTLQELDCFFPNQPIYLSRYDGHSGVTNSKGLEKLGLKTEYLFVEKKHFEILSHLPAFSKDSRIEFLKSACRIFNSAGFTHIRDLGGNESQFELALQLESQGLLSLQVEWNFPCQDLNEFESALEQALRCRSKKSRLNQMQGIKFFFDGSLGSDTALLSKPYLHRKDCCHGNQEWSEDDAEKVIQKSWENGFEVAIHTIGDEAAHKVVDIARNISARGIGGRINLEHAEILRPETIGKMKSLHVVCHLQPCHWLSDRNWLDEKIGDLKKYAFPWEALRRAKIPFSFGSDSPVEKSSLFNNLNALTESQKSGIPRLQGDPFQYHLSPNPRVQGETEIKDNRIHRVILDNQVVFHRE